MDILSRLPVELAYQVLSNLEFEDVVTCQSVCRNWYWIAVDQSVWKGIFLKRERPFAIPTTRYSHSYLKHTEQASTPVSSSTYSASHSKETQTQRQSPETTSVIIQQPTVQDWKHKCRARVISERNWAQGNIQSLFTLKVHRGGIARLRIKDGKLLSGDMFGQVAVWDTTTWTCETLIDAAVGPIKLLDFGASAMVMTAISKSGVCRIWDLKTRMLIDSAAAVDVICMTMDDECLVLGNRDGQIQIVDFYTGESLRTSDPIAGEMLQDIYIQNNTLVVATGHFIRIMSIDTLDVLLSCPLPISPTIRTFCSVFHIRSLILLTDQHLLHVQWEPLYRAPNKQFLIDTRCELPPDLTKVPSIHRTKVPPISTITSIAIGGNHPHVLTTNADRPSLNETIRVCGTNIPSSGQQLPLPHTGGDDTEQPVPEAPMIMEVDAANDTVTNDMGIVLTSQVEEISQYLETCGLKPSFMDVDEDVIIIGTSKGDIVVLHMMPQES